MELVYISDLKSEFWGFESPSPYQIKRITMSEKKSVDPVQRRKRMLELFRPIERQIYMTDSEEDLVMLASVMVTTGKDILVQRLGSEKAKRMILTMDFGD